MIKMKGHRSRLRDMIGQSEVVKKAGTAKARPIGQIPALNSLLSVWISVSRSPKKTTFCSVLRKQPYETIGLIVAEDVESV